MDSTSNAHRPLSFYLNLNYPITLYPENGDGFTAAVMDLPGCVSQGKTVEAAIEGLQAARDRWLATAYEHGDMIPLPSTKAAYSGKALLNMPPTLHRRLADSARREGVSLNQYIVTLLSEQNAFSEISAITDKLDAIQRQLAYQQSSAHLRAQRATQTRAARDASKLND